MVFGMKLHIPPSEIDNMLWYDIMMIYNAYSEYVDKENEENRIEQDKYESEYQDKMDEYKNFNMPNVPKMDVATPNFNISNFNL